MPSVVCISLFVNCCAPTASLSLRLILFVSLDFGVDDGEVERGEGLVQVGDHGALVSYRHLYTGRYHGTFVSNSANIK